MLTHQNAEKKTGRDVSNLKPMFYWQIWGKMIFLLVAWKQPMSETSQCMMEETARKMYSGKFLCPY